MRLGGQHHALADLPRKGNTLPIIQEAGWAPGPSWTGTKYLASTGILSTSLKSTQVNPNQMTRNVNWFTKNNVIPGTMQCGVSASFFLKPICSLYQLQSHQLISNIRENVPISPRLQEDAEYLLS